MAERATSAANPASCRESVCIHTRKIFDSCKDKDCIEDLRVYPTCGSQLVIDTAFSIRPSAAKLLFADVRVEELNFNRGCYTVDVTYFYKVTGRAFPGDRTVTGLAVFRQKSRALRQRGKLKGVHLAQRRSVRKHLQPSAHSGCGGCGPACPLDENC